MPKTELHQKTDMYYQYTNIPVAYLSHKAETKVGETSKPT